GYADFNYYNGTYDSEGTALSVSAGSSPHYSNSACTNVMPNPYFPASPITYAQVPGFGCVAIYPQGYPQFFPYTYDSNQQVKIYRFALSADSDQATLNTWFLSTIRANGGTGWETSSGDIPTFLSDPSDPGLDYYLNSPEPTPLATVPFSSLCSGNICRFTDGTAPENAYIAYVAKVSGNYPFAFNKYYPCGSEDYNCYDTVFFTKENKFLNIDNAPSSAFFPSTVRSSIGNAVAGPYQTGACPPPAACTNGAINPPTCNSYNPCSNGAINPPTCNSYNPCSNGANNPPTCDTCPSGQTLVSGSCVNNCTNGAINPPTCNSCTAPLVWSGSSCVSSVNAVGGSACGASFNTAPTANLCSVGTASAVSGSGPWTWTCAGLYGGSTASCSAGINTYSFNLSKTGSGTITSSPAGINCGSTCSNVFNYGASVTLTPSAPSGYAFTGWTGDCSGTGTCTVTINGTRNATANFAALPGSFDLSLGFGGSGAAACNSVPLSWTASSNATAYRILRGSPRVDISPYQPYPALNHSDTTVSENTGYVYQIEAYNSAGTQRSNAINISTPYCPPTIDFSAFPLSIYQAQAVTLAWITTHASSCSASGAWSGSKPVNGSGIVHPLTAPITSYTLSCSGPGGAVSQSVSINVTLLDLPEWREIAPR
ncbi:MAG: hypothetical protein Q7S78_00565, partial [Candidatus Azambacteria bacterium]|nr:hypothetical protein [Candidatus Azambacteria bacterium]